ncbi:O-antigen ligase family protein [Candidatus Peregrinibacteria bacterium]|nr:O-antigen ligase family protein [Candidatus Peregrinibacteria bacterium]
MLLLLSNRAIWLSLLAGLPVVIAVFWVNRAQISPLNQIMRKRIKTLARALVYTLLISITFFVLFTQFKEEEQHLANSFASDHGSGKDRLELWKRTFQIIAEKPVSGVGLANWKTEILKFGNAGLQYYNSNQIDSAYAVIQKVDVNIKQPRFKPFLTPILKQKRKLLLVKKNNTNINTLLPDDQEWYYQQYLKHISKQIPVENVIFDALKQ